MKVISYSLFEARCERFERRAYIRGFYWNLRMNKLVYPGWQTHLFIQNSIYLEYQDLFDRLTDEGLKIWIMMYQHDLCEGMITRMRPIWFDDVTHVICRDADAITTLRESTVVEDWTTSPWDVLSLHDNSAHSGLMGGMIGVHTSRFREVFSDFNDLISGWNLSDRGSDQMLLNRKIPGKFTILERNLKDFAPNYNIPLWESELTCRHMGSAGVVEMEMLRFFQRHDPDNKKYFDIEKRFPDLFYWWI